MKAWRNAAARALKAAFTERYKGLAPQRGYARSVARVVARANKSKGIPSPLFHQLLVRAGWAHVIEETVDAVFPQDARPVASDLESRALYSPLDDDSGSLVPQP